MTEHRLALPRDFVLQDNYTIQEVLGQGGFGITYKAIDNALDAPVAIKEYFPETLAMRDGARSVHAQSSRKDADYEKGRQRFIREMRSLNQFSHPSILRVRAIFTANNTAYAVLDFVEGATLNQWVRQLKDPPSQERLDRLASQLLDALETVHNAGLMHRDISPDNIIVRPDGRPVLIDFGSARQFTPDSVATTSIIVKHGFSPPEQYRASQPERQGPPSDIYSLGATFYYLVTGKLLPRAEERELAVLSQQPDPLPSALHNALLEDYRSEFLGAIDWALKLKEQERPQSVAEWRGALLAEKAAAPKADELPRHAPPPPPPQPPSPSNWRDILRVGTAVVLLVAAFYLAFTAFFDRPQTDGRIASAPSAPPPPAAAAPSASDDEKAWEMARNFDGLVNYRDYLRRFPNGRYARQARDRIAELERVAQAPSAPPRSPPPAPPPAPPPRPAKTFDVLSHTTIEGGDILHANWPKMSRDACRAACEAEPRCIAYTHDGWSSSYCFLKGNLSGTTVRVEPKYESGIVSTYARPPRHPTALQMRRHRGKYFPGLGSYVTASSFEQCAEKCMADSSCWYIQFTEGVLSCELISETDEYGNSDDSDVGVKYQPN